MQIFSNDQTVRSDTGHDLKEFNNQSLATHTKKGEQLASLMPAFKKAFNLMDDDIVELYTENDALKNEKGSNDQHWLEKSKAKLLKRIDDGKRANELSRMKKQMENIK